MQSENIQKLLLTKANLTVEKALEIAQGMEAAALQAKELKGSQPSNSVHTTVRTPARRGPCGHCGCGNHDKSVCKFCNAKCHKCGKVGHIAPVYRSKAPGKPPSRKTKWLSTTTTEPAPSPEEPTTPPDESREESLFVVRDTLCSPPPYLVELRVNGQPLTMEIDTGAGSSVAPESAVAALLPSNKLQPYTGLPLRTYTGEPIPIKGVLPVTVKYGQQSHHNLRLVVVRGSGPSLLGRD